MSRITRKLSAIRVHFSWSRISFPCLPVTRRKFAKSIVSSASGAMYHHIPVLDNLLLVSLDGKHLSSCVLYRLAAQEAAQRDPGYASQYRRRPRLAGLSGLGDWTSFGGEVRVNLEKPSEKNIRWSHRSRGPFSVPVLRSRRGESCVLVLFLCCEERLGYRATLPSKKYLLSLLPCRNEENSNFSRKAVVFSCCPLLYVQFARLPLENVKEPNRNWNGPAGRYYETTLASLSL